MKQVKIKVTYSDYSGTIMAKIFFIDGWYDVINKCLSNQINDFSILKIEKILEAEENNVVDLTKKIN